MNDYLIDQEVLSQFVDELIKKKALPVNSPEELNNLRENSIKELDRRIGRAIFGRFTKEQNGEFNQILDKPGVTENDFQNFFEKHNFNIEKILTNTMEAFGKEFLGGQNA